MTPHGIWFGPADRPLAGYLHLPDGQPVGGVLVCAPFGYESTAAHRTLRRLGDRLARSGRLVLRFDYAATGASAGTVHEPDLLLRWQASVAAGVAELRRRGVARPAVVGVRLGAALACAVAAGDGDLGPLVLWAPVTSGRRYHRELRAQAAITPGGIVGDGSLNVMGHLLSAELVASIRSWNPLFGLSASSRLAVVQTPGWRDADEAAADLTATGAQVTVVHLAGTAEVFEQDAEMVDVPAAVVDALHDAAVAPGGAEPSSLAAAMAETGRTRVFDGGGGLVEEEIVAVGPGRLYGVLTSSIQTTSGAGVVLLNNGVSSAVGPGRAWVDFARELAASGASTLRVDFSGLGESPDRSRRSVVREKPVPITAGAETLAAVDLLRKRGIDRVTVVGVCSGAQVAVRTAAYAGRIDAVLAVNAPLYYLADIGIGPWMRRLWAMTRWPLDKRPIRAAVHRLPERVWNVLDRLGIFPSPMRYLRRATDRGTSVHLVFSEGDRALIDLRVRAGAGVADLITYRPVTVDVIDGMDHSMFDRAYRRTVFARLREICLASSAPTLGGGTRG
jgi:dienelactone hydrolase